MIGMGEEALALPMDVLEYIRKLSDQTNREPSKPKMCQQRHFY